MQSGDKQKILYLCGTKIHPATTGGFLHTTGIARTLARAGHEVCLYSFAGRAEDYRLRGPRRESIAVEPNLHEEVHLGLGIGLLQSANRRLGYPRRWQYEMLRRGRVPNRLKQALSQASLVLADSAFVPPVPGPRQDTPWILVSHNLEHRLLEQGSPPERRSAAWMRRVEAAAPQTFHDIFACTEEDQAFFRQHDSSGSRKLPIVGSGVDAAAYASPPGTRERMRAELGLGDEDSLLIFGGSRSWQNLDALERLQAHASDQAEFLRKQRVHFLLLGSIADQPYRQGPFIATGRVGEAAPFFAASDAGINPVMKGSGANTKIYEYMAARLPVVSTQFGMRGSNLNPDEDYLPYEDGPGLRAALERLLNERDRAQWHAFADALWQREAARCDIGEMVRRAFAQLPELRV